MADMSRLKVFSGTANPDLTMAICDYLDIPLGNAVPGRFPDGELNLSYSCGARGDYAFVVQPTCPPVDQNYVELGAMLRCLRDMNAEHLVAVIPYFGYARQERKAKGKVPIMAKLMADLIEMAGATKVVCLDLHAPAIQGFFNIPVDHLSAMPVLIDALTGAEIDTIVGPDLNAGVHAEKVAGLMGKKVAIIGKKRISGKETEVKYILGLEAIRGKHVCIFDDIASTGGTIIEAAEVLLEKGALSVDVAVTHPVFAGKAFEKLSAVNGKGKPLIRHIWVTDSIPLINRIPDWFPKGKIKIVSVAKLIGEAIRQIYCRGSVSKLFSVDGYRRAVEGRGEDVTSSEDATD